jgi:hypothetical protein
MIKLLQKYKMHILVVAGIFVIISFLLADALKQIGNYSNDSKRVYTLDGQKVTHEELNRAGTHLEGLKRVINNDLMKNWQLEDDATQWQLAAAAAERAGLVGGPADGRAYAMQIATYRLTQEFGTREARFTDWKKNLMAKFGLTEEQTDARISQAADALLAGAGRTGNALAEGANAFAELRGLERLRQTYRDVPQTSENRMAAEARRLLDTAIIKYVYIPLTEARIAAAPAPTQEEMQARFEKLKDTPIGNGQGSGYRQNDRATYTWFAIDKAAVSKAMKVDPIEVQKRALAKATDGKIDPVVRRQIEDEIRGTMTQAAIDDFVGSLRTEFLRASALLPEKEGYKVLPADWKKPDLAAALTAAISRLPADRKAAFPAPQVNQVTVPQDARSFIQEKGIGTSMITRSGQAPVYLRDVLFGAKEFNKPAGRIPMQAGLPLTTPFTGNGLGGSQNLYFVMLDSAIPSASPKSLDEVRPLVEKDLRKIKALETLSKDVESVLAPIMMFGTGDAPALLEKIGYPGLMVQSGEASRVNGVMTDQRRQAQPEVEDQAYVDAVMTRAEKLDPGMKIAPDSAPERTFVHSLGSGSGVVLTQITGLRPLTQEDFRLAFVFSDQLRDRLLFQDVKPPEAPPFKTDALIKRLNVTGIDRTKKNDDAN